MRFGGRFGTRRGRLPSSTAFVVVFVALVALLLYFLLRGAATSQAVLGFLVGAAFGGTAAYLAGRAVRGRSGIVRGRKLFAAWLLYVVAIAAMISAIFVYGMPNWLFNFSGAAEFGLFLGFGPAFWGSLLPAYRRGPGSAGTGQRAALLRAGLQMSGLLVGLIAGLIPTPRVVELMSRYIAR